ncbi:MAG: antitoxin Xre/MbcA/ParS toxin-binding domain-containing protein [Thiobacillus sp.]
MMTSVVLDDSNQDRQRHVITQAAVQAANLLQIKGADLATILGLSAASVSRMRQGDYQLDPARKEWQIAVLFVRLFRSLDSIVAGREKDAIAWLNSENAALHARPVDLLKDVAGLVHVLDYLDAVRGRI